MEKLLALFGATAVPNVAQWKKWWSTKLSALQFTLGTLIAVLMQLPPHVQAQLPPNTILWLGSIIAIIGVIAPPLRAAEQKKLQ